MTDLDATRALAAAHTVADRRRIDGHTAAVNAVEALSQPGKATP